MKITLFDTEQLVNDIKSKLMGGEMEELYWITLEEDNKVKKGELSVHLYLSNVKKFATLEKTEELYIYRIYKKDADGYKEFSLQSEQISPENNYKIKQSFVRGC